MAELKILFSRKAIKFVTFAEKGQHFHAFEFKDDEVCNRVGGKRSSFLPTFVFRPLTPPYVPFGIRRFFTYDAIYC
ncbi:MAG: hypothetical protein LBV02_07680, partial [Bacteroidales bacterium]|nr:hypothetical protein [Bacteroidales bacterium]